MTSEEAQSVRHFPCLGCGAPQEFDPEAAALRCAHCGFERTIPRNRKEIQSYAYDAKLAKATAHGYGEKKRGARCVPCGAMKVVDDIVSATRCAHCGSPMVIDDAISFDDVIRPEAIIPFAIDRPSAEARFAAWAKAKGIDAPLEDLAGVYRPYWIFDAQVAGHHEEKISHTFHGGFVVEAGVGLLGVGKYRLASLMKFDPRYLAGWEAERYEHSLEKGWEIARDHLAQRVRGAISPEIRGARSVPMRPEYVTTGVRYQHVLFPLYIGRFQVDGKAYRFRINGESGEIDGDIPPPKEGRAGPIALAIVVFSILGGIIWGIVSLLRHWLKV